MVSEYHPHFIDSAGALPYPSPELHSAWPIPIRQGPRHEQKSHCDQARIQLPMSLLALAAPLPAAPAACLFERGWDFISPRHYTQQRKSLMDVEDTGQGGRSGWRGRADAGILYLRGSSDREQFPQTSSWIWADVLYQSEDDCSKPSSSTK